MIAVLLVAVPAAAVLIAIVAHALRTESRSSRAHARRIHPATWHAERGKR